MPLILLLAGSGTFNSPYKLNFEKDPLAQSLMLMDKGFLQNKLLLFFDNLNSYISRLSFYNFTGMVLKDLNTVLEWIDFGNRHIFNPLNMKMVLYLFENSYKEHKNQQKKRRSFPLDSMLLSRFPQTFKALTKFIKYKQYKKSSEIKFGLVFSRMDERQRQRQTEKINRLEKKKKEEEQNFSLQHRNSASLFSDYYVEEN